MVDFKLCISNPKTKRSYPKELKDPLSREFLQKKIREKISGDKIGFEGYEFEITGGSDISGFPMRSDLSTPVGKKKILTTAGIGVRNRTKGEKVRKTVSANFISDRIVQINLKVLKEGKEKLGPEGDEAPKDKKEKAAEEKK